MPTSIAFVMEQALGHVTHHQNLAYWAGQDATLAPTWLPIVPHAPDVWERLPGIRGNWSLKSSLRARDALKATKPVQPFEALFFHTQTTSLFALDWMRRVPTVISLDATPLNYDTVSAEYGDARGNDSWLERRKYEWNRSTFHAATALTTWCQWAKDSLVNDYGVDSGKVTVIPPGVNMAKWTFRQERPSRLGQNPLRLLFVGGDFARKGGPELVEAFCHNLRSECILDIVTKDAKAALELKGMEGIRVHQDLTANSPELCGLYAQADVFVFPTKGDCLPIAVMEAMAAGLPIITTNVGALREEVEANVNGLMIAPGDAGAITTAVRTLLADESRRMAMSRASRALAETKFDACRNYNAILTLLKTVAKEKRV